MTIASASARIQREAKRADQSKRSVEVEMLEVLAAHVPGSDDLPAQLQQSLLALDLLDNPGLEQAAKSGLAAEFSAERRCTTSSNAKA